MKLFSGAGATIYARFNDSYGWIMTDNEEGKFLSRLDNLDVAWLILQERWRSYEISGEEGETLVRAVFEDPRAKELA